MESGLILVGNLTLSDFVQLQPFGWKHQNPPILVPYKWEVLDPIAWKDGPEMYKHASFYLGAVYVLTIFILQRWMKNRPAFDLKYAMFLWNLVFFAWTFLGAFRVVPGFLHVLRQPDGFYQSICLREGADVTSGFWLFVYCVSKMLSLGDTVFIILRKRPLKLVHWYHHLCTLLVVGIGVPLMEPISRWYLVVNTVAHSFLYPYLALKILGVAISPVVPIAITIIQIGEMLTGILVNIASLYFLYKGHNCARYPVSIAAFSFVYVTFFILFGKMFYVSMQKNNRKDKTI